MECISLRRQSFVYFLPKEEDGSLQRDEFKGSAEGLNRFPVCGLTEGGIVFLADMVKGFNLSFTLG